MDKRLFQETVWEKGRELYRDMPWRNNTDPYFILVSELMLQQTQVDRVIPKFNEFIASFPSVYELARAPLSEVLILWSGLGYNRRARFLHESAKQIVESFGGLLPESVEQLVSLPGVGVNTAGAIATYGYNKSIGFVETNIRTVYFHHFFDDQDDKVSDKQLLEIVNATIDSENPREWYWALMDYGTFLKKQRVGNIAKSAHYKKQSVLAGSLREMRGRIVKALATSDYDIEQLKEVVGGDDRFAVAIEGLRKDGLIQTNDSSIYLTK